MIQSIPVPGSMLLDRYYIEKIIDHHNDTAILKSIDTRLDVPAVLKILLADPDSPEWESKKQNFIQSFRTQAKLNHPNIVHVSDIESKTNLVFSVMELLQGQSLDQHLEEFTLTPKEILEIFLSVIDAVAMGHSAGVCHMNISPKNILLNQQASRLAPRVLNFAYMRKPTELDPQHSLPFTAPELLTGFENATPASDVFSLCASLFYTFTKHPPVQLPSLNDYIQYYSQTESFLSFPEEIPVSFLEILENGLRTDPTQRFASANELLNAVKIIAKDYNLSANLTLDANKSASQRQSVPNSLTGKSASHPSVRSPSSPIPEPSKSVSQQLMAPSFSSQPIPSPPIPIPPKPPAAQSQPIINPTKSVSQQLIAPSPAVIQAAESISLPLSIAQSYMMTRVDSMNEHSCVCAISPHENPSTSFALKFLRAPLQEQMVAFNQGVQKNLQLSREHQGFQSIIMALPDAGIISNDIPRQPLTAYISQHGVFQVSTATQLAIFIAQSMEFAHSHGLINGNLKASNIILENRNGMFVPVIYDFAQNSYIDSAADLSITDIPYVAPDIDYNIPRSNFQSDIFSFGMIFIYMLLGRVPYKSDTIQSLIEEIDSIDAIPDISIYRPDLSKDLISVLNWCTAFEPNGRYATFTRLLQDLYYIYNQSVVVN